MPEGLRKHPQRFLINFCVAFFQFYTYYLSNCIFDFLHQNSDKLIRHSIHCIQYNYMYVLVETSEFPFCGEKNVGGYLGEVLNALTIKLCVRA